MPTSGNVKGRSNSSGVWPPKTSPLQTTKLNRCAGSQTASSDDRVQTRSSISAFMRGTVRRRWTMVRIVSQGGRGARQKATELVWRLAAALVGVARKALDAISPVYAASFWQCRAASVRPRNSSRHRWIGGHNGDDPKPGQGAIVGPHLRIWN